jgi:hypothetical protein
MNNFEIYLDRERDIGNMGWDGVKVGGIERKRERERERETDRERQRENIVNKRKIITMNSAVVCAIDLF